MKGESWWKIVLTAFHLETCREMKQGTNQYKFESEAIHSSENLSRQPSIGPTMGNVKIEHASMGFQM